MIRSRKGLLRQPLFRCLTIACGPAAAAVAAARAKAGLSQRELAARCGIDQSDISKIERGVANPSVATLERIARALGGSLMIQIDQQTPSAAG